MKHGWLVIASILLISSFRVAGAEAAVGYTFDVTTFYQDGGCNSSETICAAPDTGFLTVTNNGASTFTGTLTLSGTSLVSGGFCPPTGTVSDSFTGSLAPGESKTFALSTDSSNCGGFNNPNGAQFSMVGTVALGAQSEPVSLSVNDADIHSGTARVAPCDSISTDAFVLQGGSSTGCDNGDPFEISQADGHSQFFEAAGGQLTALSPAQVWVGLRNSDDVGLRLDLRAEVSVDGNLVGSGEVDNVSAGSSGFNNAVMSSIPLTLDSPVDFPTGSALSIKILVRQACAATIPRNCNNANACRARLWYNDAQAKSGFDATIDGTDEDFFLVSGFELSSTTGSGPKLTIDQGAGNRCSAFKPFGEWATP